MTFPQLVNNLVAKSANYTANPGEVVLVTTGSSALVVTLPAIGNQGVAAGPVTVRKVDGAGTGTVTVKSADGSTVDGVAGSTGRAVGSASTVTGATLATDGTNWFTVSA